MDFGEHIEKAVQEVNANTMALSRFVANIGGPCENKQCLLVSVSQLILLYEKELWNDKMEIELQLTARSSLYRHLKNLLKINLHLDMMCMFINL